MIDSRLNNLAKVLVHYSTNVKKGDFVLVQAGDIALPWIIEVAKEAVSVGAHVETLVDIPEMSELMLKIASEQQLLQERFIQRQVIERADVWLTAWGDKNTRCNANIDPARLQIAARGQSTWRKIYSERMGNGTLRWCGTQFPTQANAQEADMSLWEYEDFVYSAGLLDKDDPIAEWQRVHREQERWVKYLNDKNEIHIISKGTDIIVNTSSRRWINCDGKENFPDGEIFTSPVENAINGHITFSFPGIYMGKAIEGIYLEIKDGKVVKAAAQKGEGLLKALLDTDEGASYFGEVAIGTNYGIQRFTRNMLFDEKIGGTVHMAIGDSMPEAGGRNRSTIHWDMLCDMRKGGEIYADDQLFYKDGYFIDDVLR
ncbi:aminopeptidase [Mahella australiensis]|uniref:Peptidase M29 aminopeptidase II n=1 Tax=Mahella australiensis (strain DSM 15567 / CIP 107919 / 50-1 BON) TaxID=697281 RepID=F4A2F1_MAHA5|nr:aminopeptidase [Mahella australiensis]AEE97217.1 peptidase M29 aminopeptidase II [Mahella australiensis 50-1 BON]